MRGSKRDALIDHFKALATDYPMEWTFVTVNIPILYRKVGTHNFSLVKFPPGCMQVRLYGQAELALARSEQDRHQRTVDFGSVFNAANATRLFGKKEWLIRWNAEERATYLGTREQPYLYLLEDKWCAIVLEKITMQ